MNDFGQTRRRVAPPAVAIRTEGMGGRGGDFAGVVPLGAGRVRCYVGDVAGHGHRAIAYRDYLVGELDVLAETVRRPGALLQWLNLIVEAAWPADLFASVACVDVDLDRRRVVMASAGHLPPLVRAAAGRTRRVEIPTGPPLGVFAGQRYADTDLALDRRDEVLVFVTDGIADALTGPDDPLGLDAVGRFVEHGPADPDGVCAALFTAAGRHGCLRDDATVLAIGLAAAGTHARPAIAAAVVGAGALGPPQPRGLTVVP